jgi:peptidoglycan-associated lipoprotein
MNRLTVILLICSALYLASCSMGKRAMKKGDKRLKYGEFEYSIDYYQKAIRNNYNVGEANFKIGEAYRLSNRLKEAEPYYQAAINQDYEEEDAYYFYGLALKSNEKYEEARQELQDYLGFAEDGEIRELAQNEVDNLIKLKEIRNKESYYRVKNLELINSPDAEYSPVYMNGELYFTSSRYGGKVYKATGESFTNLYKVKTRGAIVDSTTITSLGDNINSPNTNDGLYCIFTRRADNGVC